PPDTFAHPYRALALILTDGFGAGLAPYTEYVLTASKSWVLLAVGCCLALTAGLGVRLAGQTTSPLVIQVDIDRVVHPLTAEIVASAIEQAEKRNAALVLVRLDTPGGLLSATEDIIRQLIASKVPVVTYVGPSGGKAASAGFLILVAGDVAAMAPGTNTGAAHPVLAMGGEMDEVMKLKVENDAAAKVRAITEKRGRNSELAEEAVISSRAFTEEEALEQNLIELISPNTADLLLQLDRRTVKRFDGTETVLHLQGAVVEPTALSYRQRVLLPLINPGLALIVLVLGVLGVYVEFTHPGLILPGVAGGVLVLVGLMALSLLPINWAGAALIVFGASCLVMEAFVVSHGVLAIGGIVAMALGIVMLIDTEIPELSIGWGMALTIVVPFALITVFLLQLAVRAFRSKVLTGSEALIDAIGSARTDIAEDGRVFIHGELWNASASTPIAAGSKVRISAVDGLRLTVEPVEE
ncbi:MAG: nodulation protein NfeD, partial [Acidobacteria bacterium]|nr:nodulation protein NfeD [Acidobacteriota bacterium]